MKKLQLHNIMKTGDIHDSLLSPALKKFLSESENEYTDNLHNEHLYAIGILLERINEPDNGLLNQPSKKVIKELGKIQTILGENDCAYLRVTSF